jgi:response regulator RpfG family c-di-GMP phosphodiesterase
MENYSKEELLELVDDLSNRLARSIFDNYNILSSVVSFTEKYFEGSHSRFVSEKSALIASELGFDDEGVMETKMAGMLHDLGKIAFSDNMLYKNSAEMSGDELKKYHLYPELGMQLLKSSPNYDSIGRIIHQHRERLDGSGFPRHMKKDDIHPSAKIIGVVDLFHTWIYKRLKKRSQYEQPSNPQTNSSSYLDMTSERYQGTINYLLKKRGSLFEKKVVDLLYEIMEEERKMIGRKAIKRIMVNEVEDGMLFAEDYHTDYGLLIAAKGEIVNANMKSTLVKFAENGHLPQKILVIQ